MMKTAGRIRLYTPLVVTKCAEDGYATPMQHWVTRATVDAFIPGFSHSLFHCLRYNVEVGKTPAFLNDS
jgi:hypothetical protein